MTNSIFRFLFVFCFAGLSNVSAQINLVPNPSFEDTIVCNNGFADRPKNWFPPTLGSPDRFSLIPSSGGCIDYLPLNQYWGGGGYVFNIQPHSGTTYAGFGAMGNPNTDNREYIAIRLSDSLLQNKKYIISYYLRLRLDSKYAIDAIGVALTNDSITDYTTSGILNINADSDHFGKGLLSDTSNWVLVNDTIIANGGELFFVRR